ncbi:universal stress protein [Hoyosella subflava]|uniref:Putative universal stress protein n=1 Tax=Hoyosella subflava (strain DSM 45089 / JCM 17490 / NBRC 109087 / DQS3-9A1) TaxID=443218 RepID=F6EPU6_HOYSD|nr:universal stress protein [Hoyosella subflava]AEF40575.1 putative universal stress protein [Hoyosella subflava DQS3-9A1]
MSEKQPIVVGVDGSEESYDAVRWAAHDAAQAHAPLMLFSVTGGFLSTWMPSSYFADLERESFASIERAERVVREEVGDGLVDVLSRIVTGPPVRELVVMSKSASRIVVGSQGGMDSGISKVIGSTAAALAAHSQCPVAIVPAGAAHSRNGRIAVGIDGTRRNETAIGTAFEEAAARSAELVAVYTWAEIGTASALAGRDFPWDETRVAEEIILAEALAGWSEKYPEVDVNRCVVADDAARTLAELSRTLDLVVVGSRRRGGFMGMVVGSTSIALLDSAQSPLLIVH